MVNRIHEAIKKQQQWIKYPHARTLLTRLIRDELNAAFKNQGKKECFNGKGVLYVPFTGCDIESFDD